MRQKKQNRFFIILVSILLLLCIAGGAIWYTQFGSDKSEPETAEQKKPDAKKETIPVEGGGESVRMSDNILEYHYADEDVESYESIKFVKNTISISTQDEISDTKLLQIIEPLTKANVVGNMWNTNFIIKLDGEYSFSEIEGLCTELEKLPGISLAIPLYHSGWSTSHIPKGPKWNKPDDRS